MIERIEESMIMSENESETLKGVEKNIMDF
jgi:hypothetical protein